MRIHALVLGLVLGCGGSAKHTAPPPPPPDPIPKTAGPSCKAVADHLATLADRDPTGDDSKIAAPLREQCEHDGWNDEARSCFATAQNDDEVDGCKTKLTDLQRKSFGGSAPAAPAAAAAPAPEAPKKSTRAPVKKGSSKSSDPEEGGE